MTVSNRDTSSCCNIIGQLQAESMQSLQAEIRALEARYPGLRGRFVVNLQSPGDENGRCGLGTSRTEWTQLLRQGKCYGLQVTQLAVAAQNSFVSLRNPAGSTKNLLVRAASADVAATAAIAWRIDNVVLGAGNNLGTRLLPPLTGTNSLGLVNSGSQVGYSGSLIYAQDVLANTAAGPPWGGDFICELPVGFALHVFNQTVNQYVAVNFAWAEVDAASYPT